MTIVIKIVLLGEILARFMDTTWVEMLDENCSKK